MAAEHCVDARDQLTGIEWLCEVVIGAHFQADNAIDVLALRRQHDDRDRLARPAQAAAYRQPVLAGQHQIQHHEMRRIALQLLVDVARVHQRGDLEPLFAEIAGEKVAQTRIVIDDENLGGRRFGHHGHD